MKIEFRVALTTEAEPILWEETAVLVNGEVVMSDFVDAKRNLVSSFPSLDNTPRSLDLVNIPARIRGECIDTFKLSCGFLVLVLTLFICKAPNYVLARTLTERVV